MARIVVNGVTIASGGNITIVNGRIIVDGQHAALNGELGEAKVFNIVVEGDVEKVSGEFASIEVQGNAGRVDSVSGSVKVAGSVSGKVETVSGSVRVEGTVAGDVRTVSGNVRHS